MSGWRKFDGYLRFASAHRVRPALADPYTCSPPPQVTFVQLPPSSDTGASETLCVEVGHTIRYHSPSAGLCAGLVAVISPSGDELCTWRFAHQRHLPGANLRSKEVSGKNCPDPYTHCLGRKISSTFPGMRSGIHLPAACRWCSPTRGTPWDIRPWWAFALCGP